MVIGNTCGFLVNSEEILTCFSKFPNKNLANGIISGQLQPLALTFIPKLPWLL